MCSSIGGPICLFIVYLAVLFESQHLNKKTNCYSVSDSCSKYNTFFSIYHPHPLRIHHALPLTGLKFWRGLNEEVHNNINLRWEWASKHKNRCDRINLNLERHRRCLLATNHSHCPNIFLGTLISLVFCILCQTYLKKRNFSTSFDTLDKRRI